MIITWLLSGTDSLFVTFEASFPPSLRSGANDATRATNKLFALQKSCDCSIYMVKPVGPRFGQIMVRKNLDWWILSGIAFIICANQLHLPKNDREGLKLFLKMALNKCNTNFRLEYSVRKNRTTFSDVPLLQEIFRWNDPKCHVPFSFLTDFPETFCK